MSLHGAPWSSMELHGGLHGVPDNVGGPVRESSDLMVIIYNYYTYINSHAGTPEKQ